MSSISDDRKRLADLFAIASDEEHEQLTAAEIEAQLESKDVTAVYRVSRDALLTALFAVIGMQHTGYRVDPELGEEIELLRSAYQQSRDKKVRIHGEESVRAQEGVIAGLFNSARIKYHG